MLKRPTLTLIMLPGRRMVKWSAYRRVFAEADLAAAQKKDDRILAHEADPCQGSKPTAPAKISNEEEPDLDPLIVESQSRQLAPKESPLKHRSSVLLSRSRDRGPDLDREVIDRRVRYPISNQWRMNQWNGVNLPSRTTTLATYLTLVSWRRVKKQGTESTYKSRLADQDLGRVGLRVVDTRSTLLGNHRRKRTLSHSLERSTTSSRLGNSIERFQHNHPSHQDENGPCQNLLRIPMVSQLRLLESAVNTNGTTATANREVPS